jgi:glycogen operon protein
MDDDQWQEAHARCVEVYVNGDHVGVDRRGERIVDETFLLLLNGHHEPVPFVLPPETWGEKWSVAVDTATGDVDPVDAVVTAGGGTLELEGRSVVLLRRA